MLIGLALYEGPPEDTFGWVLFVVRALFALAWVPGALLWTFSEPVPVRGGVVFPGLVTDEVVAADRVAHVVAARDVAGVRLVEPDELHVFEPGVISSADTPEGEAASLRALFAVPGARSGKRPGPVLLGLAAAAASFLATMLAR